MALADRVHIARRFQRAIRIDTDLADPAALEGFICPPSSADILKTMARHVAENGQGAFTWTGPYGSGKSSLVVAFSALLNGDDNLRYRAASVLGGSTATTIWDALPLRTRGWRVLPVVGRRDRPAQVVGEAIEATGLLTGKAPKIWGEQRALECLQNLAARYPRAGGGLLVFIDEMGKFLEAAAYDGTDIYFFQQLAELASRSNKRLTVVGILHQAFEEYAHRLAREMRDEWAKIQGRFVDLAVNIGGDEQIDLLGRAIESDRGPEKPSALAEGVAALRRRTSPHLAQMLEDCWPLHPIVACLLGPLSRRRFGQNQRSIFGFLNSTEPQGFQDFLRSADDGDLYAPDRLWDYLRINLEPSIMASPDGHRWALAADVLERCEAMGGEELHLRLLKTIGLVDLLKDRSGLVASFDLLKHALPDCGSEEITQALGELQDWALIIFRKFSNAYAIFEGSDFDIERAVEQALTTISEVDFARLNALADLQPIVAKRHYHTTGALRWFDVALIPLAEVEQATANYAPRHGSIGAFFLAIPTQGELGKEIEHICRRAADRAKDWDIVIGSPQGAWDITSLAQQLLASEQVSDETPELQGDQVARREVEARIALLQGRLESELGRASNNALWYRKDHDAKPLTRTELNSLASDLADARFKSAPRLHNELLNRIKPSSNAVAAQNALLRRMVLNEGEARLGIDGFPAEGGLFASLLEATGLYRRTIQGWTFVTPTVNDEDTCNLVPAWRAAIRFLENKADRTVSVDEIYDIWRQAPFGIKDGLLPVLTVAFILSKRHDLAFYRQGIFQARMSDLDMDYLVKDPTDIQLRWMDLSDVSRRLLSDMAAIVRELDEENTLTDLEPIDVARGLVAIYDRLPPWVARTQRLSANAKRVRQLFKQANDPNKLIFDDIPHVLSNGVELGEEEALRRIEDHMREGLMELRQAYPVMLHRLRETLLAELQVPNASPPMLAELRARAENIRQLGGDHRLEAFVVRLAQFQGGDEDMESLASMATNKPSRNWVDSDIDRAAVELAELAQQFNRAEIFARVKGRPDKRHAMAVVVGMGGRPTPVHDEFDITDLERGGVDALIAQVDTALNRSGEKRRNIILAALAELSARYLKAAAANPAESWRKKRKAS